MSLDNNQDSIYFELEYKTINRDKIKLFHNSFVELNKDKCKMMCGEKKYELTEYFELKNNFADNTSIKIQLGINNNITDISNMFYECTKLLSIRDIPNFYNSITDNNKQSSISNDNLLKSVSEESKYSNVNEKHENYFSEYIISSIPKINTNTFSLSGTHDLKYFKENILS